jgi:hypothetical protein
MEMPVYFSRPTAHCRSDGLLWITWMLKESLRKPREPIILVGLVRLMALGLSAVAGACMIGPDYKPPPATVAKVWMEVGKASVDTGRQEYRDWWWSLMIRC